MHLAYIQGIVSSNLTRRTPRSAGLVSRDAFARKLNVNVTERRTCPAESGMAIRYSGGLKINVVYRDAGDYRAVVTEYGHGASRRNKAVVFVRPAASGFGRGIAYDSPKAYDEIARSALSFAVDDGHTWISDLGTYDRELTDWHVGRTEREAWPR